MIDQVEALRREFTIQASLEGGIDRVFTAMQDLGFEALIYDYTPVPFDVDGALMIPSLLKLRNVDERIRDYWCDRWYFRIYPVQRLAARVSTPFFWDYENRSETAISQYMTEDTAPVRRFLQGLNIARGVTIPVHSCRGDYATVTGIRFGATRDFEKDWMKTVAEFGLLAHVFHETSFSHFDEDALQVSGSRLTERERQCLAYTAQGLSAKEISRIIDRSVPTVVMHLNSAVRKLGARNRTQAVVRALHYRLIEPSYHS